MERKSGILAFLTALIPGVGYLYLGLQRKGVQALILWLIISPIFNLLGLGFLNILKFPFWFYTFFDTINLAARIDKGEFIPDSDFLFLGKVFQGSNDIPGKSSFNPNIKISNEGLAYLSGWALVILGGVSLLNKVFRGNQIFNVIKHNLSIYLLPVLLVLAGIYLLVKDNKKY